MADSGWDVANKVGIIFTIGGTIFTVLTWWMLGSLKSQLLKKHRIPEVYIKLEKELMPKLRSKLHAADWNDASQRESLEIVYEIKGHLQNVRPNLTAKEAPQAKMLVRLMSERRYILVKVNFDKEHFAKIHNELLTFVGLLDGLMRDNEVRRI